MHAAHISMSENDNEIESPTQRLGSMKKLILFNNIRVRLLEQLCFLDIKTESHSNLINGLSDFLRHRGQLELEHSRSLDKILNYFQISHNELTLNLMRPTSNDSNDINLLYILRSNKQWPFHTAYTCWHQLIGETQSLSYDYAALSELYNNNVITKLQNVLRIYRKYYELVYETHEEILRILRNFYITTKAYNICQKEYKGLGQKFRSADTRRKWVQHAVRKEKLQGNKKHVLAEKHNEISPSDKLETLKARNVYKQYTEASNATLHKHMFRDLRDIIHGMDSGFCLMVSRAILAHTTSEHKQYYSKLHPIEDLRLAIQTMGVRVDRKTLLEKNYGDSLTCKSSKFRSQLNEEKNETYIRNVLHFEFELQFQLLKLKEYNLRKNLENVYRLLDMVEINSAENIKSVVDTGTLTKPLSVKQKEDGKIYSSTLANISPTAKQITLNSSSQRARLEYRAHIQKGLSYLPKLFGGSLEEYLKATNEQIPLIMRSCIKAINLFGLHSQGIFRVSGSQVEILNFRDSFERGEDPLAGVTDASDMNSVAGVLKLYLRELQEPLFPTKYFDIFISLIQMDSKYEVVTGMRNFFKNISKSVVIVIRFLFSFLNHLSENANENMMDAFNLAISFGPTLMPAPEDKKQVQYQTQLNELIKVIIVYHQEIFPKDLGGPLYDKCLSDEIFNKCTRF